MSRSDATIRWVDGIERMDTGITVGKLVSLLQTLDPWLVVRVNPVTQNLILSDGRWVDIAEETVYEPEEGE